MTTSHCSLLQILLSCIVNHPHLYTWNLRHQPFSSINTTVDHRLYVTNKHIRDKSVDSSPVHRRYNAAIMTLTAIWPSPSLAPVGLVLIHSATNTNIAHHININVRRITKIRTVISSYVSRKWDRCFWTFILPGTRVSLNCCSAAHLYLTGRNLSFEVRVTMITSEFH